LAKTFERVLPLSPLRDAEVRVDALELRVCGRGVRQCAADLPDPGQRGGQAPAEVARRDVAPARAVVLGGDRRLQRGGVRAQPHASLPTAELASDGVRVLTADGAAARIFRCCLCAPLETQLRLARRLVARELSAGERETYGLTGEG
jgi:hypothetical protein